MPPQPFLFSCPFAAAGSTAPSSRLPTLPEGLATSGHLLPSVQLPSHVLHLCMPHQCWLLMGKLRRHRWSRTSTLQNIIVLYISPRKYSWENSSSEHSHSMKNITTATPLTVFKLQAVYCEHCKWKGKILYVAQRLPSGTTSAADSSTQVKWMPQLLLCLGE